MKKKYLDVEFCDDWGESSHAARTTHTTHDTQNKRLIHLHVYCEEHCNVTGKLLFISYIS